MGTTAIVLQKRGVKVGDRVVMAASELDSLFEVLRRREYRIVGPALRDGAIVYDDLRSARDLPRGWTDEQDGGRYRLVRGEDGAFFSYAVGPHAAKRFLFPPTLALWRAEKDERGFRIIPGDAPPERLAFIGLRACELHAIAIQDRVFLRGTHADESYRVRREEAFLVAVQCGRAGGTCFCASMATGPRLPAGFDLALTELLSPSRDDLVLEIGSERGACVASELPYRPATADDLEAAEACVRRAAEGMGRSLDTTGLEDLLLRHHEDPHWDEVARRCLTCANCTLVCPTCFCASVDDTSDLAGSRAERLRRWDSCFTLDFSYVHGGSVRTSPGARYRQWITHKLSTWHRQFGTSGCVGCGRCITWCPVGIDITSEVRALRDADAQGEKGQSHGDG
jgi:sulfhydrogenase subunit beta (sulfur reductase)